MLINFLANSICVFAFSTVVSGTDPFDAVLMECILPTMSGPDTCGAILASGEWVGVRVFVCLYM